MAAGVVLMTLALYRYGGVEGVVQRVQVQFAVEQPHDDYVPTPEAVAEHSDEELSGLAESLPAPAGNPAPAATETPSPLAGQLASLAQAPAGSDQYRQASHVPPAQRARQEPSAAAEPARAAESATAPAATAPAATSPAPAFPPAARIEGISHYWQTWNNCGPATLAMNLSYFGSKIGQDEDRPDPAPVQGRQERQPGGAGRSSRARRGCGATVRVQRRREPPQGAARRRASRCWSRRGTSRSRTTAWATTGCSSATTTRRQEWIAYDSYDSHGIKRGEPYAGHPPALRRRSTRSGRSSTARTCSSTTRRTRRRSKP